MPLKCKVNIHIHVLQQEQEALLSRRSNIYGDEVKRNQISISRSHFVGTVNATHFWENVICFY
jgi:hypothetical protein